MLDPRLYRAALVPVLVAVLVAAFSLENRPRPIGTTLAPDAFDGASATRILEDLFDEAPERAAGDAGDARVAERVATLLRRDISGGRVEVLQDQGETVDGGRTLTTVIGSRPGLPGPGIVVLAHRDAREAPSRAALSGTAAMLELARVTGEGRLRRTITFVSTSGGASGGAGAVRAARRLSGQEVDAVLVLGDLAGETIRKPFVLGASSGYGQAPLQLRRTVESAVRIEAGTDPGGARASLQWARLALPVATTEQGPLLDAGLPAVAIQVSGDRGPQPTTPLAERRLEVFGRATLRAVTAIDNGPDLQGGPEAVVVTQRKVLPAWAVRLLVGALLLPPLLVVVDGFARLRRRREAVAPWLRWVVSLAVPFALAGGLVVALGAAGTFGAPPSAPPPSALAVDGTATGTLIAVGLLLALGFAARPVVLRALGLGPTKRKPKPRTTRDGRPIPVPQGGLGTGGSQPGSDAAAMAVLMVAVPAALAVWAVNPHAALFLVPALHLWLAALSPDLGLRGPFAAVLAVLATLPLGLPLLAHALHLGLSPPEAAWLATLLVGGGAVAPVTWLLWSLVWGTAVAAVVVAARRPPGELDVPREVTVRGPVSYAGPGSLGGTESALRR